MVPQIALILSLTICLGGFCFIGADRAASPGSQPRLQNGLSMQALEQ